MKQQIKSFFLISVLLSSTLILLFNPIPVYAITQTTDNLEAANPNMQNGEGTSGTIRADFDPSPSLAVLYIYIDDTTEGAFNSISDENSNTWTLARSATNSNQNLRVYYTNDPTVNADNTITVSFTAATDWGLDVHTYDGTDTSTVIDHSAENTGTDDIPTVTFSLTSDDSLVIFAYGQTTNNGALDTAGFGTGQVDRGTFAQGSDEKNAGGNSNEIVTATGSNDQTVDLTKSGQWVAMAIEFNAAGGGSFTENPQDTNTATDSVSTLTVGTRNPQDTNTATDSVSTLTVGTRNPQDTSTATDSVSNLVVGTRNPQDTSTTSDNVSTQLARTTNPQDTVSTSDNVSLSVTGTRNPQDTNTATDNVSAGASGSRNPQDTATTSDNVGTVKTTSVNPQDTSTVSDNVSTQFVGAVNPQDTATATDSVTRVKDSAVSPSDTASTSDNVSLSVTGSRNPQDTATVTDFALARNLSPIFTDSVTACDQITITRGTLVIIIDCNNNLIGGTVQQVHLRVNEPTVDRMGGIKAGDCPGGFYVSGISTEGEIICTVLPP